MENRESISRTALRLFVRSGYEGTGVQALVEETGLSKPTIYHWFGSKRGILDAIIDEHFSVILPRMTAACEYRRDLPKTLDETAAAYFDTAAEYPQFMQMFLSMHHGAPGSESKIAVEPSIEKLYGLFDELFEKASQDHGNMKGKSHMLAAHFFGVLNTHVFLFLDSHAELDPDTRRSALHMFSYGIYT